MSFHLAAHLLPGQNLEYVMGVRRDILHIKNDIPKLDSWPILQE